MPIILLLGKWLVTFLGDHTTCRASGNIAWKAFTVAHIWRPEINLDLGNHIMEYSMCQLLSIICKSHRFLHATRPQNTLVIKYSYCPSNSTIWLSPHSWWFCMEIWVRRFLNHSRNFKKWLKVTPISIPTSPETVVVNTCVLEPRYSDTFIYLFFLLVTKGLINSKVIHFVILIAHCWGINDIQTIQDSLNHNFYRRLTLRHIRFLMTMPLHIWQLPVLLPY